jgi:DHA1 family tetracycline resistance protein-like MFS transporter
MKAALRFIFVTILLDILGFGIIIPVLPKLVADLAGGNTGNGALMFGMMLSVYGLAQFLFLPVLGSLSDRYGRRPILLVSMFFSAVEFVIMALATNIWVLFIGRLLTGITGASMTVANAYIVDVSTPEKRAANFGMVGAAFGIGFILGPAFGGLLSIWSARAPFWASAVLSLANFCYGLFVLPESLGIEHRRRFNLRSAIPAAGVRILMRVGWVRMLSLCLILVSLAQQSLQSTWVLYTTYRFHWSELDNGLSLTLVGLTSGLVQAGLTGKLVARIGESRTVVLGLCLSSAGFLGYALSTQGWMMAIWIMVWSLSGVAGPSINSLISQEYGPDEQGMLQGSVVSLQSLMGIVGPLLGTGIFSYYTEPPRHLPGAPFFMASALAGLGVLVALVALRRRRACEPSIGAALPTEATPVDERQEWQVRNKA